METDAHAASLVMETDAAVPAALPDDVLVAILGRLLARSLATSRWVCKAWRDLVDERGLLLRIRHLLPHKVTGMFVNYADHGKTHFFARPASSSAAAAATGTGSTLEGDFVSSLLPESHRYDPYLIVDHCNGLVLYRGENTGELYVINPTTQRWVGLPQLAGRAVSLRRAYLVFSPAMSQHYKVLVAPLDLAPVEEAQWQNDLLQVMHPAGDTEWPPSRWTWHVFSSRCGRWQEREFVREGAAAAIVADLRMDSLCFAPKPQWRYAVYRQGALYVHCRGEYVCRLSLSTGDYSYRVIKSPIDRSGYYIDRHEWDMNVLSYLGRSNGEVYFVAINMSRLRVWMLNDHDSQQHNATMMAGSEWILKHDRVLRPDAWYDLGPGPWILDDYYNHRKQRMRLGSGILDNYHNRRKERGKFDWSSDGGDDDDDIICSSAYSEEENDNDVYPETFHFLGFHPYKEIIFLAAFNSVAAYHLSTSKVQHLGEFRPSEHNYGLYDSFVYTPCSDLRHRG